MAKRSGLPTSADVARLAGVSKWTVIRAFDPKGTIAQDTRARVLEAANRLGYAPNLLARSLASRRTNQIAVLIDDFGNPYKLPTLERLTAGLQAHGMQALLVNINDNFDHLAALSDARQRRADAVVMFGTAFTPEMLGNMGTGPVYVLARGSDVPGIVALHTDPLPAMETLGNHLWQTGRRRPAFLCGPRTQSTALGRRRAMRAFWLRHGIEMAEIPAAAYALDSGAQAVRAGFDPDRYDALICENDILAIGAIEALRGERGVDIPGQVAVTGFDDIDLACLRPYDLTTWHQPFDEMADLLVRFLTGAEEARTTLFAGRFVRRSST